MAGLMNARRGPGLKAILVGALVLMMSVPLFFVALITDERQDRANEVARNIGYDWGGQAQTVAGPFLVVPIDRNTVRGQGSEWSDVRERRYLVVLPDTLTIEAEAESQRLHRGIYEVPVYGAQIHVSGAFPAVDLAPHVASNDVILWDDAFVTLSLSDARGIRSRVMLSMLGREIPFEPGQGLALVSQSGAHAPLGQGFSPETVRSAQPFDFTFQLNGSSELRFVPLGQDSRVRLTSDWVSPSFQGAFLPVRRELTEEGFTAEWAVPSLARSFPDSYVVTAGNESSYVAPMTRAAFGVDFHVALDFYQKTFRALRYAIIFIGFTFLVFFLIELILKTRLHPVQYIMVGAAQSLFYLLLLSASEHIGFGPAFGLAAVATVMLITVYGSAVTRSRRVGGALLAALSLLYVLLYNLLQVEDFALLYGSVAAFVGLAVTMMLTRNVDWYGNRPTPESVPEGA